MKHINAVNRKTFAGELLRLPLYIALVAILVASMSGCTEQRIEGPRTEMSVRDARRTLMDSLAHTRGEPTMGIKISRQKFSFSYLEDGKAKGFSALFKSFHPIGIRAIESTSAPGVRVSYGDGGHINFEPGPYAMNFIDSIFALRKAAMAPDTEESDFSAFSVSAKGWLAASSKPKMADDALTYRLLAEDAFKRKDFTTALEAYSDALSRHPMWPDGHYNAALLAADSEDFELASRHMRRYLVLSPDAKDSASAKEKFLLWQHKANPGGAPVAEKRIDGPRTEMSVRDARRTLMDSLAHTTGAPTMEIRISRQKFSLSYLQDGKATILSQPFEGFHSIGVQTFESYSRVTYGGGGWMNFKPGPYAMNFIDSMFALKKAAMAPDTEESDFAAFAVSAKDWLAASSKPKMVDEALTYRLLAEEAYKRKDFITALEAYSDALSRHPLWPDGQYSAALLAAEAEDFELASRHMRRYLVLSPDAKDAAAAKENFLLWQHKAKSGAPGKVKLGVGLSEISQEARERFGIPASVNGLVITEVAPGSRAADAGLLPGNVIVEVDRVVVSKPAEAVAIIGKSQGDMLLRLWTKDGTRDVVVKERKDN